ncbi:MAG TPA: hypothetical protein VFS08_14075 [Gemmatimonadaceae bacterium]|nr:hypothetical protein [Gemmatimonadaceae bacterium]
MYATCLHCTRALGRNAVIESFPVGRRLAFDAATGRLWVVCPHCARWNLSPLEERWEAIEDAERRFRDTRRRVSTDNIGLARLREGLELVRVGQPQRPELAAWRYGRQLGDRRRHHVIAAGAMAVGGTLLVGGGAVAAAVVAAASAPLVFGVAAGVLQRTVRDRRASRAVAHLRAPVGRLLHVRRQHLPQTSIEPGEDGGLALRVAHDGGRTRLTGEAARRAATMLLRAVNRAGGTRDEVALAVRRLEHAGDAERFLRTLGQRGPRLTRVANTVDREREQRVDFDAPLESGLLALPVTLSLAAEMALHEAQERRALEGELAALEAAWREAEEIAAIADGLLLPTRVQRVLEGLRTGRANG